jgi:thiol-disulfide isomerase/thioredoxin
MLAAGGRNYETLLRFINYPSEKHKEMAGQQQADDYPAFKGGSFIKPDYWLMETPQNSLVFSALLGNDSVMMALVDSNLNGSYNDKDVDLLLLGDYKTASISDRPGEGRHSLADSTLLAVEGNFYQLLEVAPDGAYIRLRQVTQQTYAQATEGGLTKGSPILDLPFTTLAGQRTSLHQELRPGKFVLLDFWGTWCKGCLIQSGKVKRLHDLYPDQLTIIGFNYKDDVQKAKQYVAAQQLLWTQGIADKSLVELLLVNRFPFYVLIDPEQKIHSFAISLEEVEKLLKATKQ